MSSNTNRIKGNSNIGFRKYANKSFAYLKGVNKIVLVLVGLFLLLVVGIIVYWVYKAIVKARKGDDENPILVSGSIDASDPDSSKSWVLPNSSGSNSPNMSFTISFWMYIADWYYRVDDPKAILIKDVSSNGSVAGTSCAPGIWLAPDKNNLIVATRVLGRNKPQVCNVANIPIQKWVHVAYVLDNRTVDVYVDCKLERSCILSGVPFLNNHKLHLFPKNPSSPGGSGTTDNQTGFLGQLSSLRYFSQALKPVDIARICNEGPNATVGETSKGHKPNDNNSYSCPTKFDYKELSLVKKQLTKSLKEVDNIMDHQDVVPTDQPTPVLRRLDSNMDPNCENVSTVNKQWIMYPDMDMPGNDMRCVEYPLHTDINILKQKCLKTPGCAGFIRARYQDKNKIFVCYKTKAGEEYLKKYGMGWSGESYIIK